MDAPCLIYVYSIPGDSEEMTQENYAAACCAVQNLLLAAVAEGLAGDWSTGGVTRHPQLAETLGAEAGWTMVGALFIGKPSRPSASVRTLLVPAETRAPGTTAPYWSSTTPRTDPSDGRMRCMAICSPAAFCCGSGSTCVA